MITNESTKETSVKLSKSQTYLLNTLLDVLQYHTWGGNEAIMRQYVLTALELLQFKTEVDKAGNIIAVHGIAEKYPLLNAHMDIIYSVSWKVREKIKELQSEQTSTALTLLPPAKTCGKCAFFDACIEARAKEKTISNKKAYYQIRNCKGCEQFADDFEDSNYLIHLIYDKDYLKEMKKEIIKTRVYNFTSWEEDKRNADKILDEMYKITFDEKTGRISSSEERVLGGDDKCGIALALATAFALPNQPMKILFTTGEESGCKGIDEFVKERASWFDDVKYSITIDRRGADNLLRWSAGRENCSKVFAAQLALHGTLANIPVKIENGFLADVCVIRQYVGETANISAGYYNPHTTGEYIMFYEMCDILEWLKRIILYVKVEGKNEKK